MLKQKEKHIQKRSNGNWALKSYNVPLNATKITQIKEIENYFRENKQEIERNKGEKEWLFKTSNWTCDKKYASAVFGVNMEA